MRASGTEPLVRVMVEAATHDEAEAVAKELVGAVERAGPRAGRATACRADDRPVACPPMCGIVAILTRPDGRQEPAPDDILAALDAAVAVPLPPSAPPPAVVAPSPRHVGRGRPAAAGRGRRDGAGRPPRPARRRRSPASTCSTPGPTRSSATSRRLDDPADLEAGNAALVELRDALWAVRRDRLRAAAAVADLAGRHAGPAALAAFTAVQMALSAIDRLEVRGRDSAGLHLTVWDHGLDLDRAPVRALLAPRAADPLFTSGSVRVTPEGALSFVYKAAAEIGELGDNTAALRAALRDDGLLQLALAAPTARVDGARPHPLGQRRHHLRGQRPPAQPRGGGRRRPARTSSRR